MVPLLKGLWTDELEVVYGDKAYLSRINVTHIHSLGAGVVIEPKGGLTGTAWGHREYVKLVKKCLRNPDEWEEKYSTER